MSPTQPSSTQSSAGTSAPASPANQLSTHGLDLRYGDKVVVGGLDVTLPGGAVTAIVGPNACGKSTLLRGLARLIAPEAGTVAIDGDDVHRMSARALARRLGLLPQQPVAPEGI
ncbi:MAG: ABC transporter ATP-binding protein, partial [Streptomyces sp.]